MSSSQVTGSPFPTNQAELLNLLMSNPHELGHAYSSLASQVNALSSKMNEAVNQSSIDIQPNITRYDIRGYDLNTPITKDLVTKAHTLGLSQVLDKQYNEAVTSFKKALQLSARMGGVSYEDAIILRDLGKSHVALGNNEKAKESFLKALTISNEFFNKDYLDIQTELDKLASS